MSQYQRVLLKISGEALAGANSFGLDPERVRLLATEIAEVAKEGVQVGLVVGGGNFFRGVAAAAKKPWSALRSALRLVYEAPVGA